MSPERSPAPRTVGRPSSDADDRFDFFAGNTRKSGFGDATAVRVATGLRPHRRSAGGDGRLS
jgi:hypothetical protein